MSKNENPMPLGKLPGYLNSNRSSSNNEDSCVMVDMGKIVEKKKRLPFQLILAVAICLFIGTTTILNYASTQQMTVVVGLNENVDPETISEIVSNSGGKIISLKQNGSFYEVKVSTKKSRLSFLELLHKNKNIKDAEFK
jgi:hypothetical protein